jgi:hypothetical protein
MDARTEQILAEEERWRAARDEERATRQTARTIGLMAMVDCAWQIYSRVDGEPDEFVVDADGEAVGGIVLQVGDKVTEFDEETGEVTRVRSFVTIDPTNLRLHNLTEKQVDPDRIVTPDAALSHRVIGRVARLLCSQHVKSKSLLADEERRLANCAIIWRLATGLRRGLAT